MITRNATLQYLSMGYQNLTRHGMVPILILLSLGAPQMVLGQEHSTDTLSTTTQQEYTLDNIVVEAPRVVRKANMDVLYPSAQARSLSQDGLKLLQHLMIPGMDVNIALETITVGGKDVQVRINGREATSAELKTLLPSSIKRMEWMDNPGLRYGDADYVLNVIVQNPEVGGALMLSLKQSPHVAWGTYNASMKLNQGHSQWELGGWGKLTKDFRMLRSYNETFNYPDGRQLERKEEILKGRLNNSYYNGWLSYSYVRPDTTTIYTRLRMWHPLNNLTDYYGLMHMSDGSADRLMHGMNNDYGLNPSLSLYWEQHLAHKQVIALDASVSMHSGRSYYNLAEYQLSPGQEVPADLEQHTLPKVTDVKTDIRELNYAFGLKANYIKSWQHSELTTGLTYYGNRNRSQYQSSDGALYHQRRDELYLFGEYTYRFPKVSVTAGLGGRYTSFSYRESQQGSRSWGLLPRLSLSYRPSTAHQIITRVTSWSTSPSLNQSNIVLQQTDAIRWSVGNPHLSSSTTYHFSADYKFMTEGFDATLRADAQLRPHDITPRWHWDSKGRMISTYENAKLGSFYALSLSSQWEMIPSWLTLSGRIQYRVDQSIGKGYDLVHRDWSGSLSVSLTHWGWMLMFQIQRSQRSLWGERLSWGEDINALLLSYNTQRWGIGAGVLMPFGEYDHGEKLYNKSFAYEAHLRPNLKIAYLHLSYNLQWGKQKRSVQRLVEADVAVQRSSAGGR